MPLPLPNLDARRFDDLVAEMRALIPRYAPEWTDHNPSDPGMTLVDLLAWVAEATLYRVNRIPVGTRRNFVTLLSGEDLQEGETLEAAGRRALQLFHEPFRAVTAEDFDYQAKRAAEEARASDPRIEAVARVRVMADGDEGTVTVVVVPAKAAPSVLQPQPSAGLLNVVRGRLNERKLVGTRVLVRGPRYTPVRLGVTVALEPNAGPQTVTAEVEAVIRDYLDPFTGGPTRDGWPFGRPLSVFELYRLIEPVSGVDHVTTVLMNGSASIREVPVTELLSLTQMTVTPEASP